MKIAIITLLTFNVFVFNNCKSIIFTMYGDNLTKETKNNVIHRCYYYATNGYNLDDIFNLSDGNNGNK